MSQKTALISCKSGVNRCSYHHFISMTPKECRQTDGQMAFQLYIRTCSRCVFVCVCVLFNTISYVHLSYFVALEKKLYKHDETWPPVPPADTFDTVKHTDTKGIQGYQNSCYLDATLYGMFTFSDAFDILFLEEVTTNVEELDLQKRLKNEIVYPLRK